MLQLVMAITSSLLTIYLTASTSFITRKDSGVLSETFAEDDDNGKVDPPVPGSEQKRRVLYYVRTPVKTLSLS